MKRTAALGLAALLVPGALVVLGLLAVVVLFGGSESAGLLAMNDTVADLAMRAALLLPGRANTRSALRAAASEQGVNPAWVDAIAWVESRWDVSAVGDAGRSFGPTQIQAATLRANGYTGDPAELTRNAPLAGYWTAILLQGGSRNAQGVQLLTTPASFADAVAWWNAGKPTLGEAPEVTQSDYYPKALAALGSIGVVA